MTSIRQRGPTFTAHEMANHWSMAYILNMTYCTRLYVVGVGSHLVFRADVDTLGVQRGYEKLYRVAPAVLYLEDDNDVDTRALSTMIGKYLFWLKGRVTKELEAARD